MFSFSNVPGRALNTFTDAYNACFNRTLTLDRRWLTIENLPLRLPTVVTAGRASARLKVLRCSCVAILLKTMETL